MGPDIKQISAAEAISYVGKTVGASAWFDVTQEGVNAFADLTGDHNFIHVDIEKAQATPLGGTIAHGFYTLSLLASMAKDVVLVLDGVKMALNYGLDKVRFIAPVKVGSRVRAHFKLDAVDERPDGALRFTYAVTVEIEGEDKPALSAQWHMLQAV